MTASVIPFTFSQQTVRVVMIDDAPWFVAADVAEALDYRMASDMTRSLDDDEKGTQIVRTPSGDQEMLIINESGLYSAILKSRKPEAKRFKRWVTHEVLPSIRKTGRYEAQPASADTLLPSEQQTLKEVAHRRVAALPADMHGRALAEIWSRVQNKFRVARYSQLTRQQFADAIAYIMTLELHCAPQSGNAPSADTRERISERDLAAIRHVIGIIADRMHFSQAWSQGLWRYLRLSLNNPAPNPWYVDQLPHIERLLAQALAVAEALHTHEARAEKTALSHLLGRSQQALEQTLQELHDRLQDDIERARLQKLDAPPYFRDALSAIADRMRPMLHAQQWRGLEMAAS